MKNYKITIPCAVVEQHVLVLENGVESVIKPGPIVVPASLTHYDFTPGDTRVIYANVVKEFTAEIYISEEEFLQYEPEYTDLSHGYIARTCRRYSHTYQEYIPEDSKIFTYTEVDSVKKAKKHGIILSHTVEEEKIKCKIPLLSTVILSKITDFYKTNIINKED